MTAVDARADWLTWRSQGIGASDVAGILGISPWASPWSVWADKTGLIPGDNESEAMEFGRWAELMIAPWFTDRTGLVVAGEQTRLEHPGHPWRRCTVDGFVVESEHSALADAHGLLQIKTTGPSKRWEQIPPHVQAQEQWELHVSGLRRVWLPVLHGRRLEVYELERDEQDIAFIVERVAAFWEDHVLAGQPPATDGHDATARALAHIYPTHTPGMAIEMDHLVDTIRGLQEAKAAKKDAERAEKTAAAEIRSALGNAEEGTVGGQRAVTLRTQTKTTTCKACGDRRESDPFRVLRLSKEIGT